MPRLLIHLPQHQLVTFQPDINGLYGQLWRAMAAQGWDMQLARRRSVDTVADPDEADLHLVHQGRVRQPRVLNTGLGYLPGSWYMDPMGVYGDSSVHDATFDPETIPQHWADGFMRRLQRRYVAKRRSKHEQPEARHDFADKAISVFLQGPSAIATRTAYMSEAEMVEGILDAAKGRRVRIKFHPRNEDPGMRRTLRAWQRIYPNIEIVDAHVHDMLRQSLVSCSLSSSVALEGMLFGVPALLCGRSDLRHCAITLKQGDDVAAALDRATETDWPYARFLYWLLRQQMLSLWHDDWLEVAQSRLHACLDRETTAE